MKTHFPAINFGKFHRLLCFFFGLSLLLSNAKATELSGVYTIDPNLAASAANFKNIPSALAYLTGMGTRTDGGVNNTAPFGVSGPVIFNIKSGTYIGPFVFPHVVGASASNTITFQSAVMHADSVKLERYDGETDAVVILDSAHYISIKHLTMFSFGPGIELIRKASFNTMDSCKIETASIPIYANNFLGGNNRFTHNILGGYDHAIYFRGVSDSLRTDSNVFSDNKMSLGALSSFAVCNFQYIQDFKISNNIISGGNAKGIAVNGSYGGLEITRNTITVSSEGLSLVNVFATAGSPAFIVNNVVRCSSGNAIVNRTSSWQRFYHNTVRTTSAGMLVVYNTPASSDNEWRNNIIYCGNAVVGNITNSGSNNTWNYNSYFRALGAMYFTGYATFNAWKLSGQDLNSVTGSPGFMNIPSDLHLKDICSGTQMGVSLPGVTNDIEGNLRNNPPTKGAYEYIDTNSLSMLTPLVSPSGGGYTAGLYDVTVNVKNLGRNAVASFNIGYTLNNGTPVSQLWTGTLAPCSVVSVTFTGSNQVSLSNLANTLKVYTYNPNGAAEFRPSDDTLTADLYLKLSSGTYTIGHSGADFSSFSDAAFALNNGGVSGPVRFEVATGTYDENFSVSSVPGVSATNTITFVSAAGDADSVVIENTAQMTPVIDINTSNVSFKYITVNANGGHAFQLSGATSYDSITHCKILSANNGIYSIGLTGYNNVFSYNTITGNLGITLTGISETQTTDTNVVSHNTVNALSDYGIYCEYANKISIQNNIVKSGGRGLYMNYCDSGTTSNNAISSSSLALEHKNSKGHRFTHNSILSSGDHGVSVNYDLPQWTGNEWINNMITSYGNTGSAMFIQGASGANTWDYNLYYSADTAADLITGYAALADWQMATSHDTESVSVHPGFASTTDLHLTNACSGRGIFLPELALDLDGNTRSNPPAMGAYEYLLVNNIGIDSLITPSATTVSIAGPQDVIVRVKNNGNNSVSGFTVSYTLNNGTPVSQVWSGTLNPCDTVSIVFSGANQVTLANTSEIAVYTHQPNALSDTRKEDDTMRVVLIAPFNGTYIIGPNPGAHFPSISASLLMLDSLGMTGPVVFNVQDGVYNEQIVFPGNIPGSSITNNITFQSQSGHADSVTIAYAMSTPEPYIVKLDDASFITFKDITFTILQQYFYTAIMLTGNASYDTIVGCKFNAPGAIDDGVNTGMILGMNLTGVNNTFTENNFNAGTIGVRLQNNPSNPGNIVTIDSNTFLNNYTAAVFTSYMNNVKIRNNTVSGSSPYDNYAAIRLDFSTGEVEVVANNITARVTGGRGILLNGCEGSSTHPQLIANNSVIMMGNSDIAGIKTESGSYQEYYHNSVNVNAPAAMFTNGAFILDAIGPGYKLKNNVFSYKGGGSAVVYPSGYRATSVESDYNNLYTTGVTLIANLPASLFSALADWQSATGADQNSISLDPPFENDTLLLQLTNACIKVPALPAVTTDIQGNLRSTPPLIGAYELALPSDDILAIGSVLQPVAPFDPGVYEMKVTVQNTAVATQTSFDVTYRRNGIDTVTVLWTGSLPQCAIDTVTFTGVAMSSKNDFIVYTSHPADSNRTNDTLKITKRSAYAGVYTIGGTTPDFSSFTEAVNALKNGGMNGAVTFNVAAGIVYPEKPIVLTDIPGKHLHALTFQRTGTGTNPVISGINGKASTDAIVSITDMDSVTFNGIDVIDDPGNVDPPSKMEYGYLVSSSAAGSKNNTIKNCRIALYRLGNTQTTGIMQTGMGGNDNNRYENVKISNAYNGIVLQSMNSTAPDSNNIITSSGGDTTIIGGAITSDIGGGSSASYGIMLIDQMVVEVSDCIIRNITVTGNTSMATGILLANMSTSTNYHSAVIRNNRIHGIRTTSVSNSANGGAVGIRIDVGTNAPATVFNNIIYDLSKNNPGTITNTTTYLRGIAHNLLGSGNAKYFNNTVYISSGSAANVSSAAFWKGGTGTPELRNNIFINVTPPQTNVNAKHFAIFLNTTSPIQSSHNLLWSSGQNGHVGYRGSDQPTMLNWKAATGQDTSSVYYLPKMNLTTYNVNTADSSSWALNGRGIHTGVATDILGNARPVNRAAGLPDIGAYEITPDSAVPAPLAIAIPSYPAPNTTQLFFSPIIPGDTVAAIMWSVSALTPTDVQVRQYVGERPPFVPDSADNYMYSYLKVDMPGGSAYNYNVDLPYKAEWLGTTTSETNLIIISKTPSGSWSPDPNSAPVLPRRVLVSPSGAYADESIVFTGTDRTVPLPVKLLNISASMRKNDVWVNWTTVTETNSQSFEVERSSSAEPAWQRIGVVPANGYSFSATGYQFMDKDAVARNKAATAIYYRLRIVDKDGRFEYSKAVSVRLNNSSRPAVTDVFPNPFSSELYITIESAGLSGVKIVLTDIAGKIVSDKMYETFGGVNTLDVSMDRSLVSGIYFLSVTDENGTSTIHKVVKR